MSSLRKVRRAVSSICSGLLAPNLFSGGRMSHHLPFELLEQRRLLAWPVGADIDSEDRELEPDESSINDWSGSATYRLNGSIKAKAQVFLVLAQGAPYNANPLLDVPGEKTTEGSPSDFKTAA